MCGRTACTLAPDVICEATSYQGKDGGSYNKPEWREHPPSKENGPGAYSYYPCSNAAPTKFTPVMAQFKKEEERREVMPMMFGMIPYYHKGSAKSHGMSTNNCRLEGIQESKLYRKSWTQRQFCVILCQGFYEWKTTGVGDAKGVKRQPYFIYAPQKDGVSVANEDSWVDGKWCEKEGWKGPELLKMAGLWDVWKEGGEEVYSYTIITMESNETMNWLHHRMPAILDTPQKLDKWLGATKDTPDKELIDLLKPVTNLQWHAVGSKVGNSRCQDMDCMRPAEETKPKNTFMDKWLQKKGPSKTGETTVKTEKIDDEDEPETKRIKLE